MKLGVYVMLLIAALLPVQAGAAVYDLSSDWSDVQNPFGAWTLMKSPTQAFTINQGDYLNNGTYQNAWADEVYALNAHVPFWMKMTVADPNSQVHNGEIELHGAEFDRTGSNQTSVVWTSPITGTANVSGAVWTTWNSGRVMAWELRKNGVALSGATLTANGTYLHDTAFDLAFGSGGAGALAQDVVAGDTLELAFISISNGGSLGDALGLRYEISVVPEPAGVSLIAGGLLATVGMLRRRKR